MRILKRNLAFVLAMVMALSLTVSAMGVEDYSDVNEIAFVEAVDVMTEMGILEGTDGEFNPTKVLNRAEAAKIIAYMLLGKNAADNLQAVTAPFADVPAKHWAAGYIAHCVNEGIINGVSATEYNPNGELTATAFAKMLLSAVGYNVNGEFTGARWETEVNALALKLGVFDGNLGAELGAGCTREEAALYAFNTLMDIETVKYSELLGSYYTGNNAFDTASGTTLNEELYDFDTKDKSDVFEREGYVWVNAKNKEVTGLYGIEADATYTAKVKAATIYADLGLSATTQADVYVDGEYDGEFQLKKGLKTEIGGNGVLVEAYVDEDENVKLVVVNTFLAKVTAATEDGEVEVTVFENNTTDNDFETEVEYAKNDYVLVTVAENEIQSMVLAEKAIGELESVATDKYIKLEGEKYNLSANVSDENWTVNYNDTMAAILDEYGYVIGLVVEEEANEIEGYVWVEMAQVQKNNLFTDEAALVKVMNLDGSGYEVLPMATKTVSNKTQVQTTDADGVLGYVNLSTLSEEAETIIKPAFYGFYMNDDDQIVLVNLDAKEAAQTLKADEGTNVVTFKKAQKGNFDGDTAKIMNSSTELVLVTKDEADTTIGYKNINIDETEVNALMLFDGKIIETIIVVDGEVISDDIYAYYNGEIEDPKNGKENMVLYVNGEPETYVKTADTTIVHKYLGATEESKATLQKGVYIIEAEGNELVKMTRVAHIERDVMTVTSAKSTYMANGDTVADRLYYAEDVKVFDMTDAGVEVSVDSIVKNDKVVYVLDRSSKATGLVTYAYIIDHVETEVNPDAVETDVEVEVVATAGTATITVSDKNAVVKVTAMKKVDGEYVVFDQNATVAMTEGVGTYNPTELAGNGNYVLKVTVDSLNAGTWGPFYLTPAAK